MKNVTLYGFNSQQGVGISFVRYRVQAGCGADPTFYPVRKGAYTWVKWAGREAVHSYPSSAEVKNS
jgi:hypothetical protein